MEPVPEEVIRHYESRDEGSRLDRGFGVIERLRTQELVDRHLPAGSARILDVGGAIGVYAIWLADRGHDVVLVDIVPSHVDKAAALQPQRGSITAHVGDARQLPVNSESFDAALVLGPLYHLPDRSDRIGALREARRAMRPGGLVFVAAISRFASLSDGLCRHRIFDDPFAEMVATDLATGQHRNDGQIPDSFTTAFFHHPDELRDEVAEAELDLIELVGLEGLSASVPDLAEHVLDESKLERLLWAARQIEHEPTTLGVSAHLLAVCRRR
jgi:SAM-dependent methyltransferase